MDIRWYTVNQITKKWVKKKDFITAFREAINNSTASAGSLININVKGRSLELPVNCPLKPLKY